eukprot:3455301-Pleurochrysis_carterae.AAC.2
MTEKRPDETIAIELGCTLFTLFNLVAWRRRGRNLWGCGRRARRRRRPRTTRPECWRRRPA